MYHIRAIQATAWRILRQLSHDHRTLALIFIVPLVLLSLLRWMFNDSIDTFNAVGPALLGVFPFALMFIVTSITTLRERVSGTMERLMTMPIGKLDFVLGYAVAFGLLAVIQALLASVLLLYVFHMPVAGPDWFLIMIALANALLGTSLGIFVSAFARTEFQAVQFMPAIVMPQLLIGGLFMPLDTMPDALAAIAHFMPLTYAISALNEIANHTEITAEAWRDFWIVVGCGVAAIVAGALTLRRKNR
jgi:ABC-2 type transport system permease protein